MRVPRPRAWGSPPGEPATADTCPRPTPPAPLPSAHGYTAATAPWSFRPHPARPGWPPHASTPCPSCPAKGTPPTPTPPGQGPPPPIRAPTCRYAPPWYSPELTGPSRQRARLTRDGCDHRDRHEHLTLDRAT